MVYIPHKALLQQLLSEEWAVIIKLIFPAVCLKVHPGGAKVQHVVYDMSSLWLLNLVNFITFTRVWMLVMMWTQQSYPFFCTGTYRVKLYESTHCMLLFASFNLQDMLWNVVQCWDASTEEVSQCDLLPDGYKAVIHWEKLSPWQSNF